MAGDAEAACSRALLPVHRRPWVSPSETLADAQFLKKFRVSKATVVVLERSLHSSVLSASDLPLERQLLTALRYYATGRMPAAAAVARLPRLRTQAVVGRVSKTIVEELKERHLDFPDTQQLERFKADFQAIGQLENVIGCVNSMHVPLGGALGLEVGVGHQQYGQRLLKVVVVCGPQGQITSLMVQPHGKTEWEVFQGSCLLNALHSGDYDGCLLAGLHFPPRNYFLVPIATPTNWFDDLFNGLHYDTLQVSSRALELLNARFPCLVTGMDKAHSSCLNIVAACTLLHNLCIKVSDPLPPGTIIAAPGPQLNLNELQNSQNREE